MQNVVDNVKRLRGELRLSQAQLSDELTRVGRPIRATGLHRLETGKRRVDADDLVGLALALGVSPITLLMPFTARGRVRLTETVEAEAIAAWDWLRGLRPVDLPDEEEEAAIRRVAFQGRAVPMGARAMGGQLAGLYERTEARPQRPALDWDGYEERRREEIEEASDGQHREAP